MSKQDNNELDDLRMLETMEGIEKQQDVAHVWISDQLDKFIRWFCHIFCWCNAVLIGCIILQVVLRYGFNNSLIVLEELQWHLYAIGVMFGVSYAQINNAHIRVDILHARFSDTTKRCIDIFGIMFFILPFCFVVIDQSLDFVADSWRVNESSDAPLGLPARWLIKSVIPLSFILLTLASVSRLIRDVVVIYRGLKSGN